MMYRLWRHFRVVYEGGWIGLIDYLKDHMQYARCGDYYAAQFDRDSTEREIHDILVCTEYAHLEVL